MNNPNFIRATGINYANELNSIRKSNVTLQPIYEAFTNSWEAIYERFGKENFQLGRIKITFRMDDSVFEGEDAQYSLIQIEVEDNGAGLNPKSYNRIVSLRDDSKGNNNKGTGRVQYVHFFNKATFDSIYSNGDGKEHVKLTLSKMEPFLQKNAILRLDLHEPTSEGEIGSTLILEGILDKKKDEAYYNNILPIDIKKELIIHFLSKFCENRKRLPNISIVRIIGDNKESQEEKIAATDIPTPEFEEDFNVFKSKLDDHNKVVDSLDSEKFQILTFCRPKDEIKANKLHYVSNGAIAQSVNIDGLQPSDAIDGNRYMFLLRSTYFDSVDNDDRGNLSLIKESDFKKQNEDCIFPEECILIDHVKDMTNAKIAQLYPSFGEKRQAAVQNLEELKELFMIDDETIASFRKRIKTSDSDESILKSIYSADSELTARGDAKLKKIYESLKTLRPEEPDYQNKLTHHVNEFTKLVPLQNRTGLTKYIARRKLVMKVFEMILNRELEKLKDGERVDESVLHNLIFHQHSDNPENSDIWLLDDQFLYFKGCSEYKLDRIYIGETKLLKENLSQEEEEYKKRQLYDGTDKDRGILRPDIFLYPEEGKCVIIEFKAPDVDVSKHLDQINMYASLINNLSDESLKIHSFYGYLIGENIDYETISDKDALFQEASNLGYIYRPGYPIKGKFNRDKGDLYTEIIKYSDILRRAKLRNKIFLEKINDF